MNTSLATLERLVSLSEAMVMTATAEDWATLVSQQSERDSLTAALPEKWLASLSVNERAQAQTLLQDCLRLDAAIGPCVESRLGELRVLLRLG
ncbi:MAG: flagellar protein FliT [Candidatus Accumulibacter sp.]|nr:flagellar protein FliT [Accumulibacter sp.]